MSAAVHHGLEPLIEFADRAPLRILSTEWRGALQCWAKSKPEGPTGGSSPIRERNPLEPYSRRMPRVLGWFQGGWRFLMGEVPLYAGRNQNLKDLKVVVHSALGAIDRGSELEPSIIGRNWNH